MATKRVTNLVGDFDTDSHEDGFGNVADFAKAAKPKPSRVYFYALPNYASDRRSDPRVRDSDSAMMLPYEDGYLERFEAIALPGFYFVEQRAGREIVGGEVFEIKAKEIIAKTEPESSTSGQVVASAVDSVRATRELMRELLPQQQGGVTKEEIAEMIKAAVGAMPQPEVRKETSEISRLRELMEFQRELQKMQPAPSADANLSDKERLYLAAMKETDVLGGLFRSMKEMASAPEREEGIGGRLFGMAERIFEAAAPTIAPTIVNRLLSGSGQPSAIPQPTAVPQPAYAAPAQLSEPVPAAQINIPETEKEASEFLLSIIAFDLEKNRRVGRAVDCVERTLERHPTLEPLLNTALQMNEQELLAFIQTRTQLELSKTEHALEWLAEFKDVLFENDNAENEIVVETNEALSVADSAKAANS